MDSLTFTPGRAYLKSNSAVPPWSVVFEDEGAAGYLYACDRSFPTEEQSILDAMLLYNVGSLDDPQRQRLATVQWSRDGLQIFYTKGIPGKAPLSTWSIFWDASNPHRFNSGAALVIGK